MPSTRTGHFPIGFCDSLSHWSKDVTLAARFALKHQFEVIEGVHKRGADEWDLDQAKVKHMSAEDGQRIEETIDLFGDIQTLREQRDLLLQPFGVCFHGQSIQPFLQLCTIALFRVSDARSNARDDA